MVRQGDRRHIGQTPEIDPRTLRPLGISPSMREGMDRGAVAEPVALLEREQEVERVHTVLREAGRRTGSVLVIEGAAGLGKSRLLEVARAAAPELGVRVL